MVSAMQRDVALHGPGGSFMVLSGDALRAGTATFERAWRISATGILEATSFLDRASGVQWVAGAEDSPAAASIGPSKGLQTTLRQAQSGAVEGESLVAELAVAANGLELVYRLQVFPGLRGVRMCRRVAGVAGGGRGDQAGSESHAPGNPSGVEIEPSRAAGGSSTDTSDLDGLSLAPGHLRLVQVSLQDQTDEHNELVFEREWLLHPAERSLSLPGCLFYVENPLTGAGLIFCKEAPLPHARPVSSPADLTVHPAARKVALVGPALGEPGGEYCFVTLAYEGGRFGRTAAFHAYQRALRPYVSGRDGLFLSNTWGDRNRDGRINAEFLSQEIAGAARLGVDVIQIDDGWQAGATSNSVRAKTDGGVWEGYYAARADFWSVNQTRFPEGLGPLVKTARERGLRFGLWFGPDSSNDFANWERDVQTILTLHRQLGVDYIKIDGVNARTEAGGRNLRAFLDSVLRQTEGKVVFDLDVTAQVRPGYVGLISPGPLFVENRYTDWHRYWPHQTLRNLWKLAHYIDPVRLRMEFLNHQRNTEQYRGDPLAPAAYRPDALFATVMFASPLGWFEVSGLPEAYFAEAAPLIAVWKEHRDRIHRGTIAPIGEAPDGACWTGFISSDADGLYVLALRELNPSADWEIRLPGVAEVPGRITGTRLGGDGTVTLERGRVLKISIPDPLRFVFARIDYGESSKG